MNKPLKYVGLLFGLFVVYVVGTLTIEGVLYNRTLERCIQDSLFVIVATDQFLDFATPESVEAADRLACRAERQQTHYAAQ